MSRLIIPLLLCLWANLAQAAPDAALVRQLAAEDSSDKVSAIRQLALAADPDAARILKAMADDKLYLAGDKAVIVDDEWGAPVDPNKIEDALKKNPDAKIVAFVHAETSTGCESDAKTISEIAHKHGCLVIMDAVTLGAERIILLHSYRVDKSYWQTPFLQQLDQYVTLGLEQAGDTVAPKIEIYKRFKPFVEDQLPSLISAGYPAYVAHPYSDAKMPFAIQHPCTVVIGPEGGFIPYEVELLVKNGCQAMSLGNRIIRTETVIPYVLGRLFSS